jgi:flagellar biosynthetic protein FliS
MTRIDLAYRKTAVEGASGFGLLMALFDTLAANLQRAADAERANDLEKRCHEVNHALLVIGCLEDWVQRGPGGELADQLIAFYTSFRRSLVGAQVRRSAKEMEQLIAKVLNIRQCWQQTEGRRQSPSGPDISSPGGMNGLSLAGTQAGALDSNWSA